MYVGNTRQIVLYNIQNYGQKLCQLLR